MLAVWNQSKRVLRAKEHVFPKMNFKPFDGTKFTNSLDNTNKKFQVGKSWYVDMLRRKSNSDLEKLWYSLLKEKLAIQSDKYSLSQKGLRIRDEVKNSYSKVVVSMARIKTVFAERKNINNEFTMLLEYWYIRNKQLSDNKFELNKEFIHIPFIKKKYERKLIENPKTKNTLVKELKMIENEKNLQLQKVKKAVIEDKEKEITKLKQEIKEKILNAYKQKKLEEKRQQEINSFKLKDLDLKTRSRLDKLQAKLNKLKKQSEKLKADKEAQTNAIGNGETTEKQVNDENVGYDNKNKVDDETKLDQYNRNIKNLSLKIKKIKKMAIRNAKSGSTGESDSTKDESKGSSSKSGQKLKKLSSDIKDDNLSNEESQENKTGDIVNLKKNAPSNNDSTNLQTPKVKKSKKTDSQDDSTDQHKKEDIKEENNNNLIETKEEKLKKLEKSFTKKEKKELDGKIQQKLRANIIRLGAKYRSVLNDYRNITIKKVAPYQKIVHRQLNNVNNIKKVGLENILQKPTIIEPVNIDSNQQKYLDILNGKIKAPIPYKPKKKAPSKTISPLTRTEISAAKNLIKRKNRNQILSYYIKNHKDLSSRGKKIVYNKIQKLRSQQAKEIFLKELSALKYQLKNKKEEVKK